MKKLTVVVFAAAGLLAFSSYTNQKLSSTATMIVEKDTLGQADEKDTLGQADFIAEKDTLGQADEKDTLGQADEKDTLGQADFAA